MQSNEQWLPVVGYEGIYEVSDQGRVRSLDRIITYPDGHEQTHMGKGLSPWSDPQGRQQVTLTINSNTKSVRVHRLVLEAFIGPCPSGMVACHWNDDSTDNRLENLRWDTPLANAQDLRRNGGQYQANKKQCINGHNFTEENTYRHPGRKRRTCRTCREVSYRRYAAKRRAS
jgi:hypothetical protein